MPAHMRRDPWYFIAAKKLQWLRKCCGRLRIFILSFTFKCSDNVAIVKICSYTLQSIGL